jgi:hypothetical protein
MPGRESSFSETDAYHRQLLSIIPSHEEVEASKTVQDFPSLQSETDDKAGFADLLPESDGEQTMYNS